MKRPIEYTPANLYYLSMTFFFHDKQILDSKLDTSSRAAVLTAINRRNWHNTLLYLIVVLFLSFALIFFIDIPSIRSYEAAAEDSLVVRTLTAGEAFWIPLVYLCMHCGIFIIALTGIPVSLYRYRSKNPGEAGFTIIAMISLLLLGVVGGLDQVRSANIDAWALNILIVSVIIYVRWPLNLIIFSPSLIPVVVGILFLQQNASVQIANLINMAIFYISVIIVSSIHYRTHYRQHVESELLKTANEQLHHLSQYDQLTDLPNRRAFTSFFETELSGLRDEKNEAWLAICDIDAFKYVNDTWGLPAGDALLQGIAKALRNAIDDKGKVARLGGEEFILYLHNETEVNASKIFDYARKAVEQTTLTWDKNIISCSISIGYCRIAIKEKDPLEASYRQADAALYEAKYNGKNCIVKRDYSGKSASGDSDKSF